LKESILNYRSGQLPVIDHFAEDLLVCLLLALDSLGCQLEEASERATQLPNAQNFSFRVMSSTIAAAQHGQAIIAPLPDVQPRIESQPQAKSQSNYKGFVAGVFSGIAKLTGMCSLDYRVYTAS
jgi:hypothetical protein